MADPSVLTHCVICSGKLQAKMKNYSILFGGEGVLNLSLFRPPLYEKPHIHFTTRFRFFKLFYGDNNNYDNDAVCFCILDSMSSRVTRRQRLWWSSG
jgi:hypothetical protein